MPILSPDTTVVYTSNTSKYHRTDGDGGARCGGITDPIETEVQNLPWYEPCKACFPGGVRIIEQKQAEIDE